MFFQRLPAFTLCFPSIDAQQYPPGFLDYVSNGLTDKHAKDTLERDFNCLNWQRECTHLIPLYTTGDGNCLLHAASLAMWGIEDKQFILRNALYDSLTTAQPGGNTLQDRCRQAVGEVLRDVNVRLSDHDWEGEWRMIVNQATPNASGHQQSLEESHIFVLANILRRPIIVYGTPKVRSFNTGGTMQNINFHGIYLPLLWGSQLCHKAPLCLAYSTGHFTALVPVSNRQNQLIVSITDNMGRELPIRFLLQAEQQNTMYLLQQYLDITQQYSSALRRQVSVAILALREAAHVPQLVNSYINAAYAEFTRQNQPYYAPNQPGAAPPQNEGVQRQLCVGCDSGVFASAETNFLCSLCYKKHQSAVSNYSGTLKCRSPGCQEKGLTSKDGYCHKCYTRNPQSGDERFYSNDFDEAGKNKVHNSLPAGGSEEAAKPKCKQCNDFFANEEFGGLCSGCFKALSIKESTEKPPAPQQPFVPPATPIQNSNNAEQAADKCYKCKQFHGDQQWGGLCSVCFKEKSKDEANMKPPRNDFQQPGPSNQQAWSNPQPLGQQPGYNQSRVNPQPPPPNHPQPAANPFGQQCMTKGCVRFADESCQGYCTQCFASSVERYQQQHQQQQQQNLFQQQQPHQYDQTRQQQQQEYERQQMEARRRQEQEEELRRKEGARQLEVKRQDQHEVSKRQQEPGYQQRQVHTTDHTTTLEQQKYLMRQKEPATSHAATTTFIGLCKNHMCSRFADAGCDGYCSMCFPLDSQISTSNATQGQKIPSPNVSPPQTQKVPAPSNPQQVPPPIKPRKNAPRTAPKAIISEEPASQSSQISSIQGSDLADICFMCAKMKPTTVNFTYSLCHKHAAIVAASFNEEDLKSPQVATKQQTQFSTEHSYNPAPESTGAQERRGSAIDNQQQRRGSAFDDQQQRRGSACDDHQQLPASRYSAEQKIVHHSGEQYGTGPPMTCHLGEQPVPSPRFPGITQPSYYAAASQSGHHNQQPMDMPNNISRSNQYNDSPVSQSHGQVGPPMNSSASYSPSGNQFSPQSGGQSSYQPYNTGGHINSHHPMQNEAPHQGSGVSQAHPQSKRPPQQNNYFGSGGGPSGNPNEIKYPPGNFDSSGDLRDQHRYDSSHVSTSSNKFNNQPHHNHHGSYDPQYSYQRQPQDHHQQSAYNQSQGGGYQGGSHQVGGNQTAGGNMPQDNNSYYASQASGHREGPGPSGQPLKPSIDTRAASDSEVAHEQFPAGKILCKYPGCSFYAIPELDNYCHDCYRDDDKSGLKNYQRCQNPQCPNKVAGSFPKYCDSCVTKR